MVAPPGRPPGWTGRTRAIRGAEGSMTSRANRGVDVGRGRVRRPGLIRSGFRVACAATALALGGCGDTATSEVQGPEAFPGSASSVQEIASRSVLALVSKDTAELRALRLSEYEHNEVVWPELPAARPEINFPIDYAWTNISLRNRRALARLFPRLEGRTATVKDVECRGEVQPFQTFQVHTDCWVRLTMQDGYEIEAQLFKDVLERNGGFKIFRFYEEPYTETPPEGANAG